MRKIIRKYKELSFQQKTILKTVIGLCFSAVLASGKLIIGLFSDYSLCTVAIYSFAILYAKLVHIIIRNGTVVTKTK